MRDSAKTKKYTCIKDIERDFFPHSEDLINKKEKSYTLDEDIFEILRKKL